MRGVIFIAILLLLSPSARALDDTPSNREEQALRYLKTSPPEELFGDMAEQVAKNLPPTERADFKKLFVKHLDLRALTEAIKGAMIKHFTADELKALADFYGSPVGKSAMKKFGVYMADVMPAIQAELIKAQAKANREKE